MKIYPLFLPVVCSVSLLAQQTLLTVPKIPLSEFINIYWIDIGTIGKIQRFRDIRMRKDENGHHNFWVKIVDPNNTSNNPPIATITFMQFTYALVNNKVYYNVNNINVYTFKYEFIDSFSNTTWQEVTGGLAADVMLAKVEQ